MLIEEYKKKSAERGFSEEVQQQANNMLIDIIYDDISYLWNQDYKEVLATQQAEYMADKHSFESYQPLLGEDLLENPHRVMRSMESAMNRD